MNKQEFIDSLRRNLSSINDYNFVNDTIAYYENYIETQMRMGKTEQQVMRELGDPRLIAKSIKATHVSEDTEEQNGYKEYEENKRFDGRRLADAVFSFNGRQIRMPSWLMTIIKTVIFLFVFFIFFTVLRWLSPFILMGLIAYFIYRTFFGKY